MMFCLRDSQSIKIKCASTRGGASFDNCLIIPAERYKTALGDSVRRCQKTESGAATAPRHEERDWGRPQRHAGGEPARHTSICAARSSTSGVVGGVAHQRLEQRNHASAAGAGPTGVWSKSERSVVGGAAAAEQERLGSRTDHHQNGHFIRTRAELRRWGNRGPLSRSRFSRPSP